MKKPQYYFIGAGIVVLLGALVFVLAQSPSIPSDDTNAIPTATTTTDIFDMEPIIPEAKVSTEGWKTCRNEEYGWEVKYPGEWYVYGEGHHSGVEGSTWGGYYANETACVGGDVVIAEWEPGTEFALLEGANVNIIANQRSLGTHWKHITNVYDFAKSNPERNVERIYNVDNEDAVMYRQSDDDFSIHVYHNLERYEISINSAHFNIFETILSTFHFFEMTASTNDM